MWQIILQLNVLKQWTFILQFLVGQDFGSGLAGWFWPSIFHEVVVKTQAELQASEYPTRLEDLLPRWFPHTAIDGKETSPCGLLPSGPGHWLPESDSVEAESDYSESKSQFPLWHNLGSDILSCLLCFNDHTNQPSYLWEGTTWWCEYQEVGFIAGQLPLHSIS